VQLEGIIFDVDGVIVETENIHRKAYNAMFRKMGIDVEWSPGDYAARLADVGGKKLEPIAEELGMPDKEATMKRLHEVKKRCYEELVDELGTQGKLVPRPGVVRLIREALQNNVRLALATASPREGASRLLRYVLGEALLDRFFALCTGYDVERTKPAPDIYIHATAQLGTAPARTVAIEDTEHGLESAKGAALACVVTPSEYTVGGSFDGADLVVPDLDHLNGERPVDLAVLDELLETARGKRR
jgi:HAD superfamily hydrolase (TIGR01509 family)